MAWRVSRLSNKSCALRRGGAQVPLLMGPVAIEILIRCRRGSARLGSMIGTQRVCNSLESSRVALRRVEFMLSDRACRRARRSAAQAPRRRRSLRRRVSHWPASRRVSSRLVSIAPHSPGKWAAAALISSSVRSGPRLTLARLAESATR